MPAERVIYETLNRLSSRFSVWVLRLDVRRTRSTAAQFSSADRLIPGSLSRHMLVMPVARMPRNVPIPVGISPSAVGHFARSCRLTPDSAKTCGNLGHRTACRETDDFPARTGPSLIGRFSVCPRTRLRLRESGRRDGQIRLQGGE
jgi:hypothetical protein